MQSCSRGVSLWAALNLLIRQKLSYCNSTKWNSQSRQDVILNTKTSLSTEWLIAAKAPVALQIWLNTHSFNCSFRSFFFLRDEVFEILKVKWDVLLFCTRSDWSTIRQNNAKITMVTVASIVYLALSNHKAMGSSPWFENVMNVSPYTLYCA